MRNYPVPDNDDERIEVLDAFALMDSSPELEYDNLVQMAARIFDAPIVLVSLVHRDRQFFKARVGLEIAETCRAVSFCTHAIMGTDVFFVADATQDERFKTNTLVSGYPNIRSYAGAPLFTASGHALGTLCVVDDKPRSLFSARDRRVLQDLAKMVVERMELRRIERGNLESRRRFTDITSTSPDAIICANSKNTITAWNTAAEAMFGYLAAEAIGQSLDIIIPHKMRAMHHGGLTRVASGGAGRILGTSVNLTAVHRDGCEFPIELSLSHWMDAGEPQFGGIIRDTTQRVEAVKQLKHAAEYDHLTGLANRSSLKQQIQAACDAQLSAAVLLVDLDGFKDVNDTLGHYAGDFVLKVTADRLRRCVPEQHMVARLGGDEFVVFMTGTAKSQEAIELGLSLIRVVEAPIEFEDSPIHIGASVGISVRSGASSDVDQMIGNADLALYQAKADGRNLVRVFTPELRQKATKKGAMSSSIRRAWKTRNSSFIFNPKYA